MATAKKTASTKKSKGPPIVSEEDESLARVIIMRARVHGSTRLNDRTLDPAQKRIIFLEAYGAAAKEQGYNLYKDLPEGTKSFISWLGGRNSHKHKPKDDPVVPKQKPVNPLEEAWWQELAVNPSMQRGLHPEDDKDVIRNLEIQGLDK